LVKNIIQNLDTSFTTKLKTSMNWPPIIGLKKKRECIKAFDADLFENSKHPSVCAACGCSIFSCQSTRLLYSDPIIQQYLHKFPDHDPFDSCGIVDSGVSLCTTCFEALQKGSIPKISIVNGFDPGCHRNLPPYLRNLTIVEERLISRSRDFSFIVTLRGWKHSGTYTKCKKNILVVRQNPTNLLNILPIAAAGLGDLINVIWVGKNRPTIEDLKPNLVVRKSVVLQALRGLIRNNPIYSNISVDQNEIDSWVDEFVPEAIVNSMTYIEDVQKEREQRTGYTYND
jgi:hypothetical protein